MRFGLIGDGRIAQRHKTAIKAIGGVTAKIYDPDHLKSQPAKVDAVRLDKNFFEDIDWVVICSPTGYHYEQVKLALSYGKQVICEKPYVLPWQPVIESTDVYVVMQLRWLDLPPTAELIRVVASRNDEYFKGPKGHPELTGGLFFDLFIHYIDLARRYNCVFEGLVQSEGAQERWIDDFNLMEIDMGIGYERMYRDIVFSSTGIRPSHVAELHWLLGKYTGKYGIAQDILHKPVRITPNGLV